MTKANCGDINAQLNRVKGQIEGIERMLQEERDELEIVQQVSAARSGLSRLAVEILKEESKECFEEKKGEKKNSEERIQKFEELVRNFFKVT
jgi:DNA-binding FrmR family transcriptional regulator